MPLTIIITFFALSSPMAPSNGVSAQAAFWIESRSSDFVIPRARILLHRWLEPSYQVRMLASFDWTLNNDESTIF